MSTIADLAAKGAVVLLLALMVSAGLRRAAAATRHQVWQAALAGALALPVLMLLLPQWTIPVFSVRARIASRAETAPAPPVARSVVVSDPSFVIPSPGTVPARAMTRRTGTSSAGVAIRADEDLRAATAVRGSARSVAAPSGWGPRVLLVWVVGLVLVLGSLIGGLARAFVIGCTAREVEDVGLRALAGRLASDLGIRRRVRLLEREGAMPMTWGALSPVILLPAAADAWPLGRQRDVLLHELAHIARHDYATRLVARLACALHWFDPLAWYAAARLRAEQESACDDQVLAAGSRPSDYAASLLEVARSLRSPAFAGATIAMARPSQLATRLLAVLEHGRTRRAAPGRRTGIAWSLAALIVMPVAAAAPGVRVVTADAPAQPRIGEPAASPAGSREVLDGRAVPSAGVRLDAGVTIASRGADTVARDSAAPAAAAAAPQGGCVWDATRRVSTRSSSQSTGGSLAQITLRLEVGLCRLEIRMRDTVRFNEDESDVAEISAGGSFIIEETGSAEDRRLEVRPSGAGLERRWFVEGRRSDNAAESRAWLAERLPIVLSRTGYGAEARAARLLRRGGVDAVLRATSELSGDYAKRIYFMVLVDSARLTPDQLRRVTRQAGQEISSDYELAELLIHVAQRFTLDEPVRAIFIEATRTIESDYEHRRVLSTALARERVSDEVAVALLSSASLIHSDYEAAELLIQFAQTNPLNDRARTAFFGAVGTLGSDYERRRVLQTLLARNRLTGPMLGDVLQAAIAIGSDFEQAELLLALAGTYTVDETLRRPFFAAVNTLGSDYEHRRVLTALMERSGSNAAVLQDVLESVARIGSDYEKAELLVQVAGRYPVGEGALRSAFLRAADTIHSDYERGRTLSALLRRQS